MRTVKIVALTLVCLIAIVGAGIWSMERSASHDPLTQMNLRYRRDHAATRVAAEPCLATQKNSTKSADEVAAAKQVCLVAANAGDPFAQYILGQLLEPESAAEAAEWYRAAAAQDFELATFALALDYLNGHGVGQDDAKGAQLMLAVAKRNLPSAQMLIADFYKTGRGVQQDDVQALFWFEVASKQASLSDEARRTMDKPYRELKARATPEQVAEAHRLAEAFRPD